MQKGSHESEQFETMARRGVDRSDSLPDCLPESLPDYGGGPSDAYFGLEPQDVDQIRWMLTLEPLERLRYVERFAAGVLALRRAGRV